MVATISIGILLVAGDVMTSTEQRAETERIEQSFVEMSQQMATVAADGDTSRSMTFDAGEKGAIVKTNTAHINITGNGVNESIRVGAIEYEGDDGTRLAYQAGGVFRETGSETQVVSEPPLKYDQRTHTFSFPVVELDEETTLSSGDVQFDQTDNTEYANSTYIEESPIRVNITSEYCVGWQTYFEEETNQINGKAVQETCSEGEQDTLRVELGRLDIAEGTFEEGIVAGNVSGDTEDVDIVEKDRETPPALDPIISRMVSEMKDNDSVTDLSDVGDTATSGTYYAESARISDELTFDLEDGNATLVVEEELIVDGGSLTVENWDQPGTDHALQVYVKDGMHVDGGNGEMCVAPCTSGEVDSEQLQVYGTSETHMAIGTGKAYFEGVMYAPGDGTFDETNDYINKEGQLVIQSNGDMDGSIVVSSAHIQSNAPEGMYDPSLETFSPEISPEGYVLPPKLSYLNIAKHTIEVENT
ncbi:hypothetical protein NP511_14700 [Natrinema thermotolerans]|uniref:DUF7305 domain-containing protein n=2 Tax=Natrinema thermotolerans TaxID=121872 RepID=A0AAF0T081_9EURY|nr:hypothetical protein [Natrinema thermotolerans]QCC59651.1 hypothetical protein DVR14_13845 [Natrinema thermotolerans]WMT06630.1 hypothetical protein NP511_14700 [Natrinema thermotolerans]